MPGTETGRHESFRGPLLSALLNLPLKKLTIWASLGVVLYILRDFFPLFFMTFVLSYMSTSIVGKIEPRVGKAKHRWIPVTLVFLVLVGLLALFFSVTIPRIKSEVRTIKEELASQRSWSDLLDAKLKSALGSDNYDWAAEEMGEPTPRRPVDTNRDGVPDSVAPVGSKSLSRGVIGHISEEDKKHYLLSLGSVVKTIWKGAAFLFMAIIFSYLFVLTLPTFQGGVKQLEQSRVADVYHEVAPSIAQFSRLMGRAFEAQTVIACVNTLVTSIGMYFLGIPQIGLLSVGVFVCSFIPVAGVFISTAPIGIIALVMPAAQGGGIGKLMGVVVMVTVAHIIEAYILNPKIYGHHMKMNPLAVLFILVLAEHVVGVWGLVIAVPLLTYVWKHLVLGQEGEA